MEIKQEKPKAPEIEVGMRVDVTSPAGDIFRWTYRRGNLVIDKIREGVYNQRTA